MSVSGRRRRGFDRNRNSGWIIWDWLGHAFHFRGLLGHLGRWVIRERTHPLSERPWAAARRELAEIATDFKLDYNERWAPARVNQHIDLTRYWINPGHYQSSSASEAIHPVGLPWVTWSQIHKWIHRFKIKSSIRKRMRGIESRVANRDWNIRRK